MFTRILIALSLSSCFYSLPVCAAKPDAIDEVIENAIRLELYKKPTWLRLLKHPEKGPVFDRASSIVSEEFFVAETGKISPREELVATLKAFAMPAMSDNDEHAQCRFPARYYWLSSLLEFPQNHEKVYCSKLEGWARFEKLESISLLMVSGYFGNPASTFGHIVIKLNNSGFKDSGDLLEQGVNYGALVPPKENTMVYVFKGLFGGYVGGFSDQKFYTQDIVYRQTEFRDMWEYELALDERARRMFVYHLWELVGKKYVYYFLEENCAYRVGEVLSLAISQPITNNIDVWYLPIELFDDLEQIEYRGHSLIKSVKFLPSTQRTLYAGYNHLTYEQAKHVDRLIEAPDSLDEVLANTDEEDAVTILAFMLDYYKYKIAAYEDSEVPQVLKDRKQDLIKRRLAYSMRPANTGIRAKPLPRPSLGSSPGRSAIGFVHNEATGSWLELSLSAFNYDTIGNVKGSLENSALKVLDGSILFDNENIRLNYLDFISVQKLYLSQTGMRDEADLSWRVRFGVKRKDLSCLKCLTLYASGGLGKSLQIYDRLFGYAIVDLSLQSRYEEYSAMPSLGMVYKYSDQVKASFEVGRRFGKNKDENIGSFGMRYSVSRNNEFRLGVQIHAEAEYSLLFNHYW